MLRSDETRKLNVLLATLSDVGISISKHKEGTKKLLALESRGESSVLSGLSNKVCNNNWLDSTDKKKLSVVVSDSSVMQTDSQTDKTDLNNLSVAPEPSIHADLTDKTDKTDKSGILSRHQIRVEI